MKATITNTSRAPQGVYSVSGLVFIDPGASRDVDVAEGYVGRLPALRFLTVKPVDLEQGNGEPPTFEAKHRGGGSYSILDADGKEVVEKMTKDEALAFNALPPAGREAFVAARQSKTEA